jgi:hypothetical protein
MNRGKMTTQGVAPSIGPNWVGFTWRWRQNPVSETSCFEK